MNKRREFLRNAFLAMNGHVFPWDSVQKNKAAGKFESLHPKIDSP
jgi:hypothetical protein